MLRRHILLCAIFAAVSVTAFGCEQADPSKPEYWIAKLEMPNPKVAIDKLRDMRVQAAVDPLMKLYDKGKNKDAIVAALIKIGDKKALPVLVKAIGDNDEADTAKQAAAAVIQWGAAADLGEEMAKIIADTKARKQVLYAALRVLAEAPVKSAAPSLLRLLKGDPDIQPIALNALAAESLGKLQNEAAIDGLIEGLWLDDSSAMRRNMNREARMALVRIGPKALPKLLKTFNRANPAVEKRARKLRYAVGGLIEAKVAELFNDIPDERAVEAMIKALETWEEMPRNIQDNKARMDNFIRSRIQKVISCASALAAIGDERAVKPLVKLASSTDIALEFRQAAVQQLAFLGSPKAVSALLKLLKDKPEVYHYASHGYQLGLSETIARVIDPKNKKNTRLFDKHLTASVKLFEGWKANKDTELKEKLAELEAVKAGKPLPTPKGKKKKKAKKPKKKLNQKQQLRIIAGEIKGIRRDIKHFEGILKAYGEVTATMGDVKECNRDVACWGKKLALKDVARRLMAAYRLAQFSDDKKTQARDALLKFGGDKDLVVRNAVIFGLRRTGDKSIIPTIAKYRAEDLKRAEKQKKYKGAASYLELTAEALKHR